MSKRHMPIYSGRMTATALRTPPTIPTRPHPVHWALAASALLLGSAALQLVASLQRWVWLRNSWTRTDITIEDSRFEYFWPADPWENLGGTAQLYGAGFLLLAAAIVAMARSVHRGEHNKRRGDYVLAIIVAASFALTGAHALLSGLLDAPTPLQFLPVQMILGVIGFVGLLVLVAWWFLDAWAVSLAAFLLLGSSMFGYLVAAFVIAPEITGYQSHDTTPWTETIVATFTAAAAVAMLVQVGVAALLKHERNLVPPVALRAPQP